MLRNLRSGLPTLSQHPSYLYNDQVQIITALYHHNIFIYCFIHLKLDLEFLATIYIWV